MIAADVVAGGLHSDAGFETWLTSLTPRLGDASLACGDAGGWRGGTICSRS